MYKLFWLNVLEAKIDGNLTRMTAVGEDDYL